MIRLPVIVGFGGVNAAGRTSFHHAYRRMIFETLAEEQKQNTLAAIGELMGLSTTAPGYEAEVLAGTLIRRIEPDLLDVRAVPYNHGIKTTGTEDGPTVFEMDARHLPDDTPNGWSIERLEKGMVRVTLTEPGEFLVPATRELKVQSGGQLPTGFQPGKRYQSRNHPRGLQMTVYGASDALMSTGIPWEDITRRVSPDQISVYAGSGMSQLDVNANGGMMSALHRGKRVTSKQCPFGFAEMPADFINAYVLGSLEPPAQAWVPARRFSTTLGRLSSISRVVAAGLCLSVIARRRLSPKLSKATRRWARSPLTRTCASWTMVR